MSLTKLIVQARKMHDLYLTQGVQYLETIGQDSDLVHILQKLNFQKFGNFVKNNVKLHMPISYYDIHTEDDTLSIGLFFLRNNAYMPLHDHPNMCVVSMGLMGQGKKTSYNITENINAQFNWWHAVNKVKVELNQEETVDPGNIVFTRPFQGNIHSFENIGNEPFVYLDVLVPHYNFLDRNCNFYTPLVKNEFKIHGFPSDYETDSIDQEINLDDFFDK